MKQMKPLLRNPLPWQRMTANRQPEVVQSPEGIMVPVQKRSRRGRKPTRTSSQPLRDVRLSRGMTLEELADISQLSPSYLSRLESGSRRLNSDTINRLAQSLQCRPNDLLETSDHWGQQAGLASAYPNQSIRTQSHLNQSISPYGNHGITRSGFTPTTQNQLLLYGSTQPGVPIDFSRPIGSVPCPPALIGVPGAFAIFIADDLMAPRYRRGDCILAHAGRPLTTNASAVIITTNNQVIIGEFVTWHSMTDLASKIQSTSTTENQGALEVKQYNTPEGQDTSDSNIILQHNQILSVAKVVGTIEA